jgi:hypothetical protein
VVCAVQGRVLFALSHTLESPRVASDDILLVHPLELLDKVVDHTVIKVLTTKMSVTNCSLDLKDTLLDSEERDIKITTSKVKDKNILSTSPV